MKISIQTGARIHLGFYGLCSSGELVLGGVGIAVSGAGYRVRVEASPETITTGCQASRALAYAARAAKLFGLKGLRVVLEDCIPQHVGLGSTTQLLSAIYASAAILAGRSIEEGLAKASSHPGYQPFSGVGRGVFLEGGLVVDTGIDTKTGRVVPAARSKTPEEWRILAVLPSVEWRVEGSREARLIGEAIKKERRDLCCKAYTALLRMILPGLALRDFQLFARGVEELDRLTGEYFSGAQKGAYCCRESEKAASILSSLGARGVGQSSWGPLVYGFYEDEERAEKSLREARRMLPENWSIYLLRPRNTGARIIVEQS